MKRVFNFLKSVLHIIGIAIGRIFGTFAWSPPTWMRFLARQAPRLIPRNASGAPRLGKKTLLALMVVTIALAIGLFWLHKWYLAQKAGEIQVQISSPGLTAIEDELRPDPLHITFSGSAAKLEAIGKAVKAGITMNPSVNGEWQWSNDTTLDFTPKVDWAVGQEYTVRLDRSLFPAHVRLATYTLKFSSQPFQADITTAEFYQDPVDPNLKKVVATVKFSHPVDTASLEKRISLTRADQKSIFPAFGTGNVRFTVQYNKYRSEAYIHSEPLEIPEKDTSLQVHIDEGVRSSKGGPASQNPVDRTVGIPGRYNFLRIGGVELTLVRNEQYEPEQVMVVNTTAAVQEAEIVRNLKAYVLPRDLPPVQGQEGHKNYHWSDPAMIGPEILSQSAVLPLNPVPREHDYEQLHSFRYTATPGSYLYVRIAKNMGAFGGYMLSDEYDTIIRVPQYPQELSIMHDGSILSLSGEKKLSIYGRDLQAVRFEIGRLLPDQINHLITQTEGDIKSPEFTNYQFDQDNITERFTEVVPLSSSGAGKAQYTSFDFSRYLATGTRTRQGLFFLRAEGWDPESKTTTGVSDKRLIMITDLGVLVKDSTDGSHDIFVQSTHSGLPIAGAKVEVLGKNGLSVISALTDEAGHASFPKLSDFEREKAPTVYVVTKDSDLSFLPFQRGERRLNLSRFDIGGEVLRGEHDRMMAYLFSDRGVYRPGDEFHVGIIVKPADWTKSLTGIPLEVAVTDARGLEVKREKLTLPQSGFVELRYKTEETAPTGSYTTYIYIVKDGMRGALLGTVTVKVEEFLPERLNISSRFTQEIKEGWVSPKGLGGVVTLKNLYGTPAVDHRIMASIVLSPAFPVFGRYSEYTFFDPHHSDKRFTDQLQETTTDDKGEAAFAFNLERFEKATYRLTFVAEGYELEGGRGVNAQSAVLVSPLAYLIGYKADSDLTYINKDSQRTVELIAIDPKLAKIAVGGLRAQLVEERYVSVLTKQNNGTYQYQSVKKEIPVAAYTLNIHAQGTLFKLPTANPGQFYLSIKDAAGVQLSRIPFSIAGQANLTRSLEKNAELQVKLAKHDFVPGEEIELSILAPYTGAGLITIERERVYAWKWFKASTTGSIQKIRIPENFDGNGYVMVSFVRAIDSPEIFMSPLSYGVMPFSVSRERRTIKIDLQTPELTLPGKNFKIRYKGSRPGKAVIYAVDEGILQVARYKTPDPLEFFLKKRALEVRTSQILDLILPEASLSKQLSAPGGDEFKEALGKNLNPFKRKRDKPVVYWSGIVDIDPTIRELIYPVPDYFNGTLRVMAVAVAPDAVGAAMKKSSIRGPFVLSPNVPSFVAPGDEFTLSIAVANNVERSGKDAPVNLSLRTSGHVEVLGGVTQALKITEGREASTAFKVRAKPVPGGASFVFTAWMGKKKVSYTATTSVRPPVPYMTTVTSGYFKNGKVDVPIERTLYPDLRTLSVSASPLPLSLAHGLVAYLQKFPYGCTEQIVSQSFPIIILKDRKEFRYLKKDAVANLEHTLNILRARQNAEGAFGFWAANSHVSDFQCVYAMHFLLEAREKGISVPPEMMNKGLRYLHVLARREPENLVQARISAYAIYILTRAGQITTNYVASLREKLDDMPAAKGWKKDLTAVYLAGAYQILKLESKAQGLIAVPGGKQVISPDYNDYYDELTYNAQYLAILAKHFPALFKRVSGAYVQALVDPIAKGTFNTTSSAYTILALDAYAAAVGDQAAADISFKEILDGATLELAKPQGLFPIVDFSERARTIRIESTSKYPTYYQVTQAGFDRGLPKREIKDKIEIQREFQDMNGRVITSTDLGTEILVKIKMRALGQEDFYNIAVVDLLPSGFEVVLDKSRPAEPAVTVEQSHPETEDTEGEDGEEAANPDEAGNGQGPSGNSGQGSWVAPIGRGGAGWQPDFIDIREDRVVLFGTLFPKVQEFTYTIKAVNRGKYTVPPVFAESMYDRTIRARGLGGIFVVK